MKLDIGQTTLSYRLKQRVIDGKQVFAWKCDSNGEQYGPTFTSEQDALDWHKEKHGAHLVQTIQLEPREKGIKSA